MVLIELGLGDFQGGVEVVVGEMRIEDFVAVVFEIGRPQTTRSRLPAMEEEDSHVAIVRTQPAVAFLQSTGDLELGKSHK